MSERYFVWGRPEPNGVPATPARTARRAPKTTPLPSRLAELLSARPTQPPSLAWPRPDQRVSGWKRSLDP